MMTDLLRSLRRNGVALLAFTLAYVAIALNLGPAFVIAGWFFNGCAYIIYVALKD
jgi:hypothetical protein